ncbi:hypothetical protein CEB3_c45940 [Peptococcaceae bacterium CEB3]|nr:hypothetical protein CEB3_c45940 [Peptococcaceae bacterium CEB3]
MGARRYVIQPGDTFYLLAQRWGGTCDDWMRANPLLNPQSLRVGEAVVLPPLGAAPEQYAQVSAGEGREFAGGHMDEMEMELAGVQFKLRRVGESRIPHEIHMILPRAEIHKVQPQGENGPTEVQIMLSNVNIVHSPRLQSGKGDLAEGSRPAAPSFPARGPARSPGAGPERAAGGPGAGASVPGGSMGGGFGANRMGSTEGGS